MFPLLVHTCLYFFGVSFHLSCIFLGFSLLSMCYKISKLLCLGVGLFTFTEPSGLVSSWTCGPPISPGKLSSLISLVISYCLLFYFHSFWYSHYSDGNLSPKFFFFFCSYIFSVLWLYFLGDSLFSIFQLSNSNFKFSNYTFNFPQLFFVASFTRSNFLSQRNFLKSLLQCCQMTKLKPWVCCSVVKGKQSVDWRSTGSHGNGALLQRGERGLGSGRGE